MVCVVCVYVCVCLNVVFVQQQFQPGHQAYLVANEHNQL